MPAVARRVAGQPLGALGHQPQPGRYGLSGGVQRGHQGQQRAVVVLALGAHPVGGHGALPLPPDAADVGDGRVLEGRLEAGGIAQPGHAQAGLPGERGGPARRRVEQEEVAAAGSGPRRGRGVGRGGCGGGRPRGRARQGPPYPLRPVQELAAAHAALGAGEVDAEEFGDGFAVLQEEDVGDPAVLFAVHPGEDAELFPAGLAEVAYAGDLARHEDRALGVEDDGGLHRGLQELRRHMLGRGGVAAGQLAGDQAVPVPGGVQQQPHARAVRAADGGEVGVDVLVVDPLPGGRQFGVQLGEFADGYDRFAPGGDPGGGVGVLLAPTRVKTSTSAPPSERGRHRVVRATVVPAGMCRGVSSFSSRTAQRVCPPTASWRASSRSTYAPVGSVVRSPSPRSASAPRSPAVNSAVNSRTPLANRSSVPSSRWRAAP